MINMKGQIYITTDINKAMGSVAYCKVLMIGEKDDRLTQLGALDAAAFIPPREAVMTNLDGDKRKFTDMYMSYLDSPTPRTFIAGIIKSMMQGTNILLYLSRDEFQMGYAQLLMYHFSEFGINIGNDQQLFLYNNSFDHIILNELYMCNFLTAEEFIRLFPLGMHFGFIATMKLVEEVPMYIPEKEFIGINPNTYGRLEKYYFQYKENVIRNNSFLVPMFQRKEN